MMKRNCRIRVTYTLIAVLTVLLALPVEGICQYRKIDSLLQLLAGSKSADTLRVRTLIALSKSYDHEGDTSNALKYASDAISLAQQLSFKKGEGEAWTQRGNIYFFVSNYEAAVPDMLHAISVYKMINDEAGIGTAYRLLGGMYTMNELYSEAVQSYYTALGYFERTGNKAGQGDCYASLGFCYYYQDNYDHAYDAFSRSLQLLSEAGKAVGYTAGHSNVYLANIHLKRNEYKDAVKYDSIGFKIGYAIGDDQVIANAYSCLGDILDRMAGDKQFSPDVATRKNYLDSALQKHFLAIDHALIAEDYNGSVDGYINITETYIALGNLAKAQEFADSAMAMANRVKTNDAFRNSYLVQSKVDSAHGNFTQAFKHHQLWGEYRNNLLRDENAKRAVQAKLLFEYNKEQELAKNAQLKKEEAAKRTRNVQYAVIGIALLIAAFLFWNNRQQQKAKAKIEQAYAELKSTQAQLIQSEKMASLGQLTAGIAHEIQNPLNFVNNFSEINNELIEEVKRETETVQNENVAELLHDIFANNEKITLHGKRADSIVKGMLQHSRTSTGHKEPTDINALADEYLRLAYHGLRAKDKTFNAQLKTDFDNSIGMAAIISQDIGRVLLNLYSNAFYAANEKLKSNAGNSADKRYEPAITVATRKLNNQVQISVSDNGNGIPKEIIDKIFQPFFTTKPTGEGTGLGLSLAYDIVKAHGGELAVQSTPGEGTIFTIILPVGKAG